MHRRHEDYRHDWSLSWPYLQSFAINFRAEEDHVYWWWDVRQLTQELVDQRVTPKQEFWYFLFWIVAVSPAFLSLGQEPSDSLMSLVRFVASMIVILAGMSLCRQANNTGDARDFLRRVVCLGAPVGVRVFLIVVFPGMTLLRGLETVSGYSFEIYFWVIIQAVYFWRLHYWMCAVSVGRMDHGRWSL
jgi:hypothetical protein